MPRYEYTAEHIEFLRTGYQSMNIWDLTRAFNNRFALQKNESAIKATLKRYKIRCGRLQKDRLRKRTSLFSEDQENFIREQYKKHSLRELPDLLNKRFNTDFTYQQVKTFVFNHKIRSGRTGHFSKGNNPWNAGTKGLGLTSANKGSFKKGNVAPNTRPLFSQRIDPKDGYILIKIDEQDPHTGSSTRFKHKHVWIWEQLHGPVPAGKVVAFKDSNPENCDPDNLILITRAELLELNKRKYKKMPAELKPSVLAVSKLSAKISSLNKGN